MSEYEPVTAEHCTCGQTFSYPAGQPSPCPACGKSRVIPQPPAPIKGLGNRAHEHDWREVEELVVEPRASIALRMARALGVVETPRPVVHLKTLCARCGLETFQPARTLTMIVPCKPRELDPDQKEAIERAAAKKAAVAAAT